MNNFEESTLEELQAELALLRSYVIGHPHISQEEREAGWMHIADLEDYLYLMA